MTVKDSSSNAGTQRAHVAWPPRRELLYLDLALEAVVRGAAERGAAASGFGAAALIAPLLQNLCLSAGDNEEAVYCLSSWQRLPEGVRCGVYPNKEDALKVAPPHYTPDARPHPHQIIRVMTRYTIGLMSRNFP